MIVKRNRPPKRRIVKRQQVGTKPQRRIVRRGGVEARRPRGPRFPSFSFSLASLKPGKKAFMASVVLFMGAMGYAGYWAYESPMFRVQDVKVEGNTTISSAAVIELANLEDESLFTADLDSAATAVLELPLLSGAKIEREWPNGVRIVVEERQAWGTWEQAGERYTIDREGVVLSRTPASPESPVVKSMDNFTLRPGDRVDASSVEAAAELYEQLPEVLGTTIANVAHLPGKGVEVSTDDGRVALLGDSSGVTYKLSVWKAVTDEAARLGLPYDSIDLRYGNRPVLN